MCFSVQHGLSLAMPVLQKYLLVFGILPLEMGGGGGNMP